MLSLKLPTPTEDHKPKISDLKACKLWIEGLQLTNPQAAHIEISKQLQQLNHYQLPLRERLKIVEQLRETIIYIQAEMAKRYEGKQVPFGAAEQQAWDSVCKLWQALELAYQYCLQGCLEGDAGVTEHVALITQRGLRCTGLLMLEHYRAYRQVEEKWWQHLHSLYAYAESRGYAATPVKDSLNTQSEFSSCVAVYVQATLINLANPYQLSFKQMNLLDRWLDKWGARVAVNSSRATSSEQAEIAVDLTGAANSPSARSDSLRYLDTKRLSEGLRKRIKFLRQGGSPGDLDVGKGCSQPECEKLLILLYKQWCEMPTARICERRDSDSAAQVCFGMPAMHFFINGKKPFEPTDKGANLDWKAAQELQMFGRVSEKSVDLRAEQLGFALETWQIQDESASGFCLVRQMQGSDRISHHQVLALRPEDGSQFVLAVVCWLTLTIAGELVLGVRVLPGVPVAIGVKPISLNHPEQSKRVPALMLPKMAALQTEPSLILPKGLFQPGKMLEVHPSAVQRLKLQALLEKGSDYERVSFIAA